MSYYRTCPSCGANLDPGEHCDCAEKAAPVLQHQDGQERYRCKSNNITLPLWQNRKEMSNMKIIEVEIPSSLWEKMKQLREAGHLEGMTDAQAVKFLVGLGLEVQK